MHSHIASALIDTGAGLAALGALVILALRGLRKAHADEKQAEAIMAGAQPSTGGPAAAPPGPRRRISP